MSVVFKGGVYMRPEMKSTRKEISIHHKRNLFTLVFIVGEMKQVSFRGSPEIYGPLSKSQSFLFTHVCLQKPFTYFYFVQYFKIFKQK